jgi:hypothetical protein
MVIFMAAFVYLLALYPLVSKVGLYLLKKENEMLEAIDPTLQSASTKVSG